MVPPLIGKRICHAINSNTTVSDHTRTHTHTHTNPGCQVTITLEVCMVVPNVCRYSVWNLLHIIVLPSKSWRWLLDFWKICSPHVCGCLCTGHACMHSHMHASACVHAHTHTHTHILKTRTGMRCNVCFCHCSCIGSGGHLTNFQSLFPRQNSGHSMKLTIHLHLMPVLRLYGALLPSLSSCNSMMLKVKDKLTLFNITHIPCNRHIKFTPTNYTTVSQDNLYYSTVFPPTCFANISHLWGDY